MAAHSSILALRISRTEETGGLQPIESHMTEATEYACIHDSSRSDFPGGPVAKTLSFQHRGCRFDPWSGN